MRLSRVLRGSRQAAPNVPRRNSRAGAASRRSGAAMTGHFGTARACRRRRRPSPAAGRAKSPAFRADLLAAICAQIGTRQSLTPVKHWHGGCSGLDNRMEYVPMTRSNMARSKTALTFWLCSSCSAGRPPRPRPGIGPIRPVQRLRRGHPKSGVHLFHARRQRQPDHGERPGGALDLPAGQRRPICRRRRRHGRRGLDLRTGQCDRQLALGGRVWEATTPRSSTRRRPTTAIRRPPPI